MNKTMLKAALAMGLFATGTAGALAESVIRVQLPADIRSTNPGVNRDGDTDSVVMHMVEGLVAYGEDGSVKPLLAESVSVSDDQLTYTFKLRKGVKFHNGSEMTSADALWSWNRYMDPKTEWRCLSEFDGRNNLKVTGVEAPDPETIVFKINSPSALFLNKLARTDCGMTAILHKDSVKPDGSWDKPIGTGPFQLAEWKQGEYVRLTKFAGYANPAGESSGYTGSKRTLVDEVRFVVVPDSSTAKAALLSGDIDLIPDMSNADVKELKDNKEIALSTAEHMGLVALLLQTRDPVLSNVKVRQAIAAAIDGDQLVAATTEGLGHRNNSVVPRSSPFYGKVEQEGWSADPQKAQQLLAEAGYKSEPITILANKRYPAMYDGAIVAQAMLQAAGINAQLEILEWATQLDRYTKGNYQAMSFSYSARLDPALSFESMMGPKDKQPRKVWDNPEAQKLLDRAMVVSDKAERQKLFDDLHRRFLEDVPMVMLYNGITTAAYSNKIKGFKSWPASSPRLWEVSVAD
ncbi:ABC transporter substrate-binding protein [Mesorhizobium sp. NPDC059054]|uniref:ABC transporter substrate-binding protein n=1 Tax=Mesorhizobium sp. NPDC059054 TaxID=3346711 RepID=UPI0036B6D497